MHAAPEPLQADSAPEEAVLRDRADWTMFRNLESLGQRAGVPRRRLPQAVAKEVADNALDHLERLRLGPGHCRLGLLEDGFYMENHGPGLPGTDEEIAALFSINRPYRSSKLLRTITRGMLGNGLRVVAVVLGRRRVARVGCAAVPDPPAAGMGMSQHVV
jgi:hypothetical protein